MKPIFRMLEELDLPQVPAALTGKTGNLVQLMAKVRRILGKDIFFGIDVGPDPRNKTRNVIFLDLPNTGSPLPRSVLETLKIS